VREILERAVEQQEAKRADARLGFDDLLAAAREVGVDPAVLREASRDLRARQHEQESDGAAIAAWVRRKRRKFYYHLGMWAIFSIAFLIGTHSFVVPFFWGIGVAMQGFGALMAGEDEWREEREKADRKNRRRQRRGQIAERVLDEGASALLTTGAALRRRVAGPRGMGQSSGSHDRSPGGAPSFNRVRVAATDTGSSHVEEVAEAEAEAAEKAPLEQQRRR
jgi:serine/threonine-protein kinase